MTLVQLRYFLAVAHAGSMSAAAAQVCVAQPALSQQIGLLETELGQPLFARHARGVTLTEAGRLLREHATAILHQVDLARDELSATAGSPIGTVSLGMATAVSMAFAVELLVEAGHRFPRIRLHLVETMSGFLLEWTETGRLDLAVVYNAPPSPHMDLEKLDTEDLFLVVASAVVYDYAPEIPFTELQHIPLILPGAPHRLRLLVEQHAGAQSIALDVLAEVDSTYAIKKLVAKGFGASILSRHAISEELASGELAALKIGPPGIARSIELVINRHRRFDPSVAALRGLVIERLGGKAISAGFP
ncbi:MAG: LysR family transcriptional regulator [Pseudomonadota bacterium]|nr:LysR family transcriptional regulator [Pseudomonadota bacterium]